MAATEGLALSIRGVSKVFPTPEGGEVRALDDVSLEVADGSFMVLLGPSGCGKTTLLRCIAGLEAPDSGQIDLKGTRIDDVPVWKRRVNTVFQSYALFPHMTVAQNVAFGLQMDKLPKDEIARKVDQSLALVRLQDLGGRRPHQLSGGQQQRVALARALAKEPEVLLLDEPLSALDLKLRRGMQLELKRLQHEVGITFVVVTHDQEEAMSMADRIAVMSDGRVEQVDSPVDLYQRPATTFVADFIGTSNAFAGDGIDGGASVAGLGVLPGHPSTDAVAGAAVLVVRPEDVRLVEAGEASGSRTPRRLGRLEGCAACRLDMPSVVLAVAAPQAGARPAGLCPLRPGAPWGLQGPRSACKLLARPAIALI